MALLTGLLAAHTTLACSAAVLVGFAGARAVSGRLGNPPLASPVLVTTIVIVVLLNLIGMPRDVFIAATAPLRWLLGPALVALALTIHGNRALLKTAAAPIFAAITVGALVGLGSAVGLARLLGIDGDVRAALVTKTVTTPFTVAIMTKVGGPVALAAALSVLTGIVGALLVPAMLDRIGMKDATARALAIGVSSHIVGTDGLMRRDSRAGGLSALAFVIVGLILAVVVPLLWPWLR